MKNVTWLLLVFLLCLSCNNSDDGESTGQEETISAVAESFVDEVVDIMEANSLNRNTIDWASFRSEVLETAGTSKTINDVYESGALRKALELLGDNHSFIRRNNGGIISASTAICPRIDPDTPEIPENIGYIFIAGFSNPNENEILAFAEGLQNIIREKDAPEITGWIVDLRINTGGNMWPMLAGIGPILGEGTAGYFIGPNGEETSWSYLQGKSVSGQNTVTEVQAPYTLINQNPKVAVLLDTATASSGEVMVVSFINRGNSASFGGATCGLSTGNSNFPLSDDSTLLLTTVVLADREKNTFGGKIQPDFPVGNDEIIAMAVDWINTN